MSKYNLILFFIVCNLIIAYSPTSFITVNTSITFTCNYIDKSSLRTTPSVNYRPILLIELEDYNSGDTRLCWLTPSYMKYPFQIKIPVERQRLGYQVMWLPKWLPQHQGDPWLNQNSDPDFQPMWMNTDLYSYIYDDKDWSGRKRLGHKKTMEVELEEMYQSIIRDEGATDNKKGKKGRK